MTKPRQGERVVLAPNGPGTGHKNVCSIHGMPLTRIQDDYSDQAIFLTEPEARALYKWLQANGFGDDCERCKSVDAAIKFDRAMAKAAKEPHD